MANYPTTTTTQFTSDIDLTQGGKVGIGITAPGTDLHIVSGSNEIKLDVSSGTYPRIQILGNDAIINRGANNKLYFGENADTGDYLFRGTGNVGIGTSSTTISLDIRKTLSDIYQHILRLNQDNATKLYTGFRIDRQSTEKWFIGVNDTDDKLRLRRAGSSDDVVIDTTGQVEVPGKLKIGSWTIEG